MSINPSDLDKLDRQIKIQKGALPMRFEKDDGDESPPDIEKAINGMGQGENAQNAAAGGIDVATALRGFWKFFDMMLSMICSRIDAIEYKNLSDAELINISQQTAQVEIFQKLAVAENAPMWLSVANLIGTFGTKFSLSDDFKAQRARKKAADELAKRQQPKPQLSPAQAEILQKIRKDSEVPIQVQRTVQEPVYDGGLDYDGSEPIEILDESEQRLKAQLAAASDVTDDQMKQMRLFKRAAAIKRKHEEDEASKRAKANINGVGILE